MALIAAEGRTQGVEDLSAATGHPAT